MPNQQQGVYVGNPVSTQQLHKAQYAEDQAEEAMHVGTGHPNLSIVHTGRNHFKPADGVYLVFVTESNDKQSQLRRHMEVNAIMPAVQRYMYGSEQPHDWSRKDHPKVMPNPGDMP